MFQIYLYTWKSKTVKLPTITTQLFNHLFTHKILSLFLLVRLLFLEYLFSLTHFFVSEFTFLSLFFSPSLIFVHVSILFLSFIYTHTHSWQKKKNSLILFLFTYSNLLCWLYIFWYVGWLFTFWMVLLMCAVELKNVRVINSIVAYSRLVVVKTIVLHFAV